VCAASARPPVTRRARRPDGRTASAAPRRAGPSIARRHRRRRVSPRPFPRWQHACLRLVYHEVLQAAASPQATPPSSSPKTGRSAGPALFGGATTNQNVREMRETGVARQHPAPARQGKQPKRTSGKEAAGGSSPYGTQWMHALVHHHTIIALHAEYIISGMACA
jgi:hypothetical protein